jgi:hypothetical protein
VAAFVARRVLGRPAHYLRVLPAPDCYTNTLVELDAETARSAVEGDWLSVHRSFYTPDRAFETLPEALRAIRDRERRAFIVIEADTDSALRHAYSYDYRLFVMPSPDSLHQVFRTPREAARALQQVMQDTSAFASEIFGLFDAASLDDSVGVVHQRSPVPVDEDEPVEHLEVGESQLRQFLNSPLGAEIASRIQLEPDYHALVEADVVVINTGVGEGTDEMDECVKRVEKLLARVRHDARRHSVLFWGDVTDTQDPTSKKLLKRLRTLFAM